MGTIILRADRAHLHLHLHLLTRRWQTRTGVSELCTLVHVANWRRSLTDALLGPMQNSVGVPDFAGLARVAKPKNLPHRRQLRAIKKPSRDMGSVPITVRQYSSAFTSQSHEQFHGGLKR